MSKWLNKSLFSEYVKEKEQEKQTSTNDNNRTQQVWKNPDKGTVDEPNVYVGRLVPDPKGKFTKKYYYHMFQSGESWTFVLCEKTFGFDNFCPFCTATQKLYKGTGSDKALASNYKRKQKHVTNYYIIDDPRDAKITDDEFKSSGKTKIYEFPDKLESKITQELFDKNNGAGMSIFDPGPDGYDFIIKVKSTKADKNGKVFPDYSDSVFARKPSSLGTDAEIKKIMESTISLDTYLLNQRKTDAEMIEILKSEMLWEMVENEWNRYKGVAKKENTPKDNVPKDDVPDFDDVNVESTDDTETDTDTDTDIDSEEAALLRELDSM